MQRLQAFKFQLRPNGCQERQMRRFAGSCRFVYNKALALQKERYEQCEKKLSWVGLCNLLPQWKKNPQHQWLSDTPSQTLQQALVNLDRAYQNFFAKRADFPRFKKKGNGDSFRYPQGFKLDQQNNRIFLPKLGWIQYRNSRAILGEAKNITVSQSCGKWYASIQTEREVEQSIPQATSAVGIDMGIARFATLSSGDYLAPLASFRRHEIRLRRYQRAMSRKVKFSKNWQKAKRRVQQVHHHIRNCRVDYLHKATSNLSQNHALIALEDLRIKNMSQSAAGTIENKGKNVKAKSGLNKSILDQGWFEFRRQLEYKMEWHGGMLIAVPPQNTSRTCPHCGHIAKENRQTQAQFLCVQCGYENNADVVGAINILERGHRLLACGETVQQGHSVKQEPTEATTQSSV